MSARDARLVKLEERDAAELRALTDAELSALVAPCSPEELAELRGMTDAQLLQVVRGRVPGGMYGGAM